MKERKRLNNRAFIGLITGLLALMWIITIAFPIVAMTTYDLVFRDIFGEAPVKTPPSANVDGVDTTYYKPDFTSYEELQKAEAAYTRKAGAEGFVLLYNSEEENKGLPIASGNKISLFSASSVDLLAGGTGSGVSTMSSDMKTALNDLGYQINESLWKFYSDNHGKYTRGGGAIMYGSSENWSINEAPIGDIPDNAKTEANGTIPVFFFSRTGGEGRDLGRHMGNWTKVEQDKDKHYLEPDSVELGVIDYLNKNFNNVIIVVNTNNAFECGWVKDYEHISAVLWAPGAGGDTCGSIADVLTGKVVPSGHLVDTFAYDAFSSPAMQNMGDIELLDSEGKVAGNGVFYDEGIYVGYKYYETRYFDKVMGQGNPGEYDYDKVVQYPFGYGKSYTTFSWSDFNMTQPDSKGDITVSVKVTNTGKVAGRDVVQVYVNVPYTEYDKTNHIEKSAVSLVGFGKTGVIEVGKDETVTVTLNVKDFISYDDVVAKTYILEAGDYYITAATDAHEATKNVLTKYGKSSEGGNEALVGTYTYSYTDNDGVDKTTYSKSLNGTAITNKFDHAVSSEITARNKYLTRNDWQGTFPVTHGNQDAKKASGFSEKNGYTWQLKVSEDIVNKLKSTDSLNPMTDAEAAKLAGEFGKEGNLELIDYRGRDFNEVEKEGGWDALINQMTKAEIKKIIEAAGYQTLAASSINKPRAIDYDGPSGLNEGGVTHAPYSITYPCAANIAASWDRENSRLHGYYVGEDAYTYGQYTKAGNHQYKGLISGWYAPAMNIHRTPFAGRNFEYYAEDGFMSGEMAIQAATACAEKGVYAYIKHFALNDQEDHRSSVATFANEQAIREIYLKPFQTCIEERPNTKIVVQNYDAQTGTFVKSEVEIPAVMAVMTAFNRVGCTWAGGNYNLITGVLRTEWGFNGSVITDYDQGGYMNTEQCVRAGGDLKLTASATSSKLNINNAASQYFARQAMKHVLYTTVNSNAMNGMVHGVQAAEMPFAYYHLISISFFIISAGLTTWGVLAIRSRLKKSKEAAAE